jgi:hypothetical protein
MDILNLTVGENVETRMTDECMSIVLNNGVPMLAFNFSVSERNIETFLNDPALFVLFADNSILFFLFKIEAFLDWSDLAFTVHLAKGEKVSDDGSYLPFHHILVESGSSIIKAM